MPLQRPSLILSLAAGTMALGGLSLLAATALLATQRPEVRVTELPDPTPCHRTCDLPDGIDFSTLSSSAADYIARRAQLCSDLACGRIDSETYAWATEELDREPPEPLPERLWANELLNFSSQYTEDSWSASQVLGEANVFPGNGDNTSAWATSDADGNSEFIEVAVPASRISAIEVYETYNPGSIESIEITTASGKSKRVFSGQPRVVQNQAGRIAITEISCTDEKVVSVRITLNTSAVPGWNEIDAIAVRPCR
jgi:hypothetical protein